MADDKPKLPKKKRFKDKKKHEKLHRKQISNPKIDPTICPQCHNNMKRAKWGFICPKCVIYVSENREIIKIEEGCDCSLCSALRGNLPPNKNFYRVNEFITLKLERRQTFIYVKERRFVQCIRLILNIPKASVRNYATIESIDEAGEIYNQYIHQNRIIQDPGAPVLRSHDISPRQEFWGHCSNIQTWAENDYDTRILHKNIAFPLLKRLTEVGDPVARRVFKDEIALRMESGYPSVVKYLMEQGYLSQLTALELENVFTPQFFKKMLKQANSSALLRSISSLRKKSPNAFKKSVLRILTEEFDINLLQKFVGHGFLHNFTGEELQTVIPPSIFEQMLQNLPHSLAPGFMKILIEKIPHVYKLSIINLLKDNFNVVVLENLLSQELLDILTDKEIEQVFSPLFFEKLLKKPNSKLLSLAIKSVVLQRVDSFKKCILNFLREDFDLTVIENLMTYGIFEFFTAAEMVSIFTPSRFENLLKENFTPEFLTKMEHIIDKAQGTFRKSILNILKEKPFNVPVITKIADSQYFDVLYKEDIRGLLKDLEVLENIIHAGYSIFSYFVHACINREPNFLKHILDTLLMTEKMKQKATEFIPRISREVSSTLFGDTLTKIIWNIENGVSKIGLHELLKLLNPKFVLDRLSKDNKLYLLKNPKSFLYKHFVKHKTTLFRIDDKGDLDLRNKKIADLSEIQGFEHHRFTITKLILDNNVISEIKGLENLTHLEHLSLRKNHITEIKGLERLKYLKILDLSHNNISEIKNIEKLTHLRVLRLNYNKISQIKGVVHLKRLKSLDLSYNKIIEINRAELPPAETIILKDNLISKISKGTGKVHTNWPIILCRVNKFITIHLEGNKSVIFVHGRRAFSMENNTVIYFKDELPLDYPKKKVVHVSMLFPLKFQGTHSVAPTPGSQFIDLYANLKVWALQGYDPRVLREDLAIPLLKRLKKERIFFTSKNLALIDESEKFLIFEEITHPSTDKLRNFEEIFFLDHTPHSDRLDTSSEKPMKSQHLRDVKCRIMRRQLSNKEMRYYQYFHKRTGVYPTNVMRNKNYVFFFIKPENLFHAKKLLKKIRSDLGKKVFIIRENISLIRMLFDLFPEIYISDVKSEFNKKTGMLYTILYISSYNERGGEVTLGTGYLTAVNNILNNYAVIENNRAITIRIKVVYVDQKKRKDENELILKLEVSKYIKSKGLEVDNKAFEGLNSLITRMLDKGVHRAKGNGRKTVRGFDL